MKIIESRVELTIPETVMLFIIIGVLGYYIGYTKGKPAERNVFYGTVNLNRDMNIPFDMPKEIKKRK